MWRNPLTNRFEAGDPPADSAPSGPTAPTPPRGGRYEGGWDFVPTPAGTPDEKGAVLAVDDVLTVGQGFSGKQTPAYGPRKADDVPKG